MTTNTGPNTTLGIHRKELIAIGLAVLIIFVCIFILIDEQLFNKYFGIADDAGNRAIIGRVTLSNRDVRIKSNMSLTWQNAAAEQDIRAGDRIFTGEDSQAGLHLNSSQVTVGANSLVVLNEIDKITVPDLSSGNFKIEVNGKFKISIRGVLTEFDGKNAQIQIVVDQDRNTLVRLLSGQAKILGKNRKDIDLSLNKAVSLNPQDLFQWDDPTTHALNGLASLKMPSQIQHFTYTDQLYDIYELKENRYLVLRPQRSEQVRLDVSLAWGLDGRKVSLFGEVSSSENFTGPKLEFKATSNSHQLSTARVGPNFWRLSEDQKNWSPPSQFFISTQTLPFRVPEMHWFDKWAVFEKGRAHLQALIQPQEEYVSYIVESSTSPSFTPSETTVGWMRAGEQNLTFSQQGFFYFRLRGMDRNQRLSAYSSVQKITVSPPPYLEMPLLSQKDMVGVVNQALSLRWKDHPQVSDYDLEILDQNNKPVETDRLKGSNWRITPKKIGQYKYKITAKDKWGQRATSEGRLIVEEDKILAKAPPPLPPAREPAAVESTISATMESPRIEYMNQSFSQSKIEFEGATFTMFSAEQLTLGNNAPVAFMVGIRNHHWVRQHGFESLIKTKAMNGNAGARETSPMILEAKYHYRFNAPWNIFSPVEETQFSLITGVEIYKNNGTTTFSPGYNAVKGGIALSFPLGQRWDSGGEILYGMTSDRSQKTELSGHLHYYQKKDFSFGAGYRASLLNAGSLATSPNRMPYREAFGEGYTTIRWHY